MQNLGGSSYRYPKLGSDKPVEDWLNHVIPALTLFRSYILTNKRQLNKFTLDVQSSTGLNPDTGYDHPPYPPKNVELYTPTNNQFGEQKLRDWMQGITFPYPLNSSGDEANELE